MDISNPIKVILVGEKDTGKTSIINRLVSDSFDQSSSATIGKTQQIIHWIRLSLIYGILQEKKNSEQLIAYFIKELK